MDSLNKRGREFWPCDLHRHPEKSRPPNDLVSICSDVGPPSAAFLLLVWKCEQRVKAGQNCLVFGFLVLSQQSLTPRSHCILSCVCEWNLGPVRSSVLAKPWCHTKSLFQEDVPLEGPSNQKFPVLLEKRWTACYLLPVLQWTTVPQWTQAVILRGKAITPVQDRRHNKQVEFFCIKENIWDYNRY